MPQYAYNPVDYHWQWTDDWYEWDSEKARKAALRKRNDMAKRLVADGFKVRKSMHRNQLTSRGGIGTGKPHIQQVVNVYCVDVID